MENEEENFQVADPERGAGGGGREGGGRMIFFLTLRNLRQNNKL